LTGFLLVCVGAAVGAPARYLMDRAIQARHETVVPWGTLLVNLTGSLILGLVTSLATAGSLPPKLTLLAGTGFCGAFTTYSAFAYETLRLAENERWTHALATVAATVTGGLGAALIGYTVGTLI
jgi:CrcB protein